jgi:hypothetical protein
VPLVRAAGEVVALAVPPRFAALLPGHLEPIAGAA